MNYFELYEMPVTLKPDVALVKKKFYELSRKYHPDFFTNATNEEQASVLEKSSMVNRAYKIFGNEDETIKYVLQLRNLVEEEEKYNLAPDFLMEVMDINEQLMDAESGDSAALTNSEVQANKILQEIYCEIKPIVENYQEGITTDVEMFLVKDYYYKKKYLQRILGKIGQLRNIAPRN